MTESVINQDSGYQEREHTADWELEVWAPDLPGLLEQAARGMYKLAGMRLSESERTQHTLNMTFTDAESLLVNFLSELLFLIEKKGLAFDKFSLEVDQGHLKAELSGVPLESLDKEIKAVTYHQLQVRQTARGLKVNIVFDV